MRVRLLPLTAAAVLLTAVPAVAQVVPPRDLLPDGDTRPVVLSASLSPPDRHNELLEADITVDAYDNDAVVGFEYRWNGPTIGRPVPLDPDHPTVDYASVAPNARYALQVRAVDVNANGSDWFTVWSGTTPDVPNLIVAGDSIASGYTRRWFTGDATCVDGGYSYGTTVAEGLAATLPAAWAPRYTNVAWAGAGVGSLIDGGTDSCGVTHRPQIDQIREIATAGTWNVVVITAGINTTNWTEVVVDLTRDTTLSFTRRGDQDACRTAVRDRWNIAQRRSYITERTREATRILTMGTNASIAWTGYYDVTGTELAPLWVPIGDACAGEMRSALAELHGAIRDGLAPGVAWIPIEGPVATQVWAGWPHPSPAGHRTIGRSVSTALTSPPAG